MEVLINTPGQTFYYSSIEELLNYCEENNNCAVIIFQADVNDFIEKLNDKINQCISQLIVIAENVNDVIAKASDKNLLVISAINTKDAIQIALNSSAMCKDVICVSSTESSKSFAEMVEMVIV